MAPRNDKRPEFFVDRSLGKSIVEGLLATGLVAHSMAVCLTNRNLRGVEQTERFVSNRHRILRQASKPGPYIYGVYEKGLKRLWPKRVE